MLPVHKRVSSYASDHGAPGPEVGSGACGIIVNNLRFHMGPTLNKQRSNCSVRTRVLKHVDEKGALIFKNVFKVQNVDNPLCMVDFMLVCPWVPFVPQSFLLLACSGDPRSVFDKTG